MATNPVNILLVDDQPAKLLSYEAILAELGDTLFKASSAKHALEILLKKDIAVILIDVCMPELDGFELAKMIRDHPRFSKIAIIFISAVVLTDLDRVKGYALGAVDYVPVPVIPELLRAKVRVFAELFRKSRELEHLNQQLEGRVSERTRELEQYANRLLESENRRSLALAAGQMGSWEWDVQEGKWTWDQGQYRIFGVKEETFSPSLDQIVSLIHCDDRDTYQTLLQQVASDTNTIQMEFRVCRPSGEVRWCLGSAASTRQAAGAVKHASGVTVDITERKDAEERQRLLAREVDHRARNALAVTQSIINLTRAADVNNYVAAIRGRVAALARTHTLLSESRWRGAELSRLLADEVAPYSAGESGRISYSGPAIALRPAMAQSVALVIHELVTNAAKHGALKSSTGRIAITWERHGDQLVLRWVETGGPTCVEPSTDGFGRKMIRATIEGQLDGSFDCEWNRKGLRYTISVPLMETDRHETPAAALGSPNPPHVKRILLVEDEPMVALMMADLIGEFGFAVVGPYCKLPDAISAAQTHQLDCAILDINIKGKMVYPLADVLSERRVPFLFVTGYASVGIDARYAQTPLIQKPIEPEILREALLRVIDSRHAFAGAGAT